MLQRFPGRRRRGWAVQEAIAGADRLRMARAVIEDQQCGREALLKAAAEFWGATFDSESWPVELQVKSLPARFRLVRHGSLEQSVARLDDAALRDLCRELIELADMADRLERRSA